MQDRLETENELQTRIAIFDDVKQRVLARDFEGLTRMADQYRLERSRTPSGTWKLTFFYAALSNEIFGADTKAKKCVNHLAEFARDWREQDPLHPASYLVEAGSYIEYGWCYRGKGLGKDLATKDYRIFQTNILIAQEILEQNSAVASVDPHYSAALIDIYKASGKSYESIYALLFRGIQSEPGYYATYFNAAHALLPRWGGRREAIVDLADLATKVTEAEEGQSLYARIYWALGDLDSVNRTMFDWERVIAGMHDVMDRYPNRWNAMSFAKMACMRGWPATAETFYKMLGEDVSAPEEIEDWRWLEEWEMCGEMMRLQAEVRSQAHLLRKLGE